MNDLKEQIKKLSSEYFEEIRGIRRHFHQQPELSCQEFKTAEFICNKLDEYGITYVKGVAETGIVAMINGQDPESGSVALRADMDALPIQEENTVVYKSQIASKMHACGHDVHMASLLGTAKILDQVKDQFKGSVKLIFQPSEETFPGGAIRMIREGVLKNPEPLSVFGQHVINTLDVGKVGMKPGPYMASTDEIYLTVKGKGGHAATPEQLVDPILIASHIVVALQQIVSRNANPIIPTVVSFGKISGEGRTNIIPDKVSLEGTVRTYDESWRKSIHEKITHMASAIASGMGGTCEVRIAHGYPYLDNDGLLTSEVREWCVDYLGEKNVVDLDARMTSEDFSYFANEVPSCFYRLGIRNEEKRIVSNLHTSKFDVDEQCLETGMGMMAWIAINRLNQ